MSLIIVTHLTASPALFGAMAAVAAKTLGLPLRHLPASFGDTTGADAAQWVAASGSLLPSGLIWYERLTGREAWPAASVPQLLDEARHQSIVVPWHPPVQPTALLRELLQQADTRGVRVRRFSVEESPQGLCVIEDATARAVTASWHRDAYGRLCESVEPSAQVCPSLLIALMGNRRDQFDVYPATLAALADAAQAGGVELTVRCLDPQAFALDALDDIDGLLLPGGSDMANVPGQLQAAHHGLTHNIPTLGLCLGMQTMATALARTLPASSEANLAEATPKASVKSFVAMADYPGLPAYRLGHMGLEFNHPTFAALLDASCSVRCNHRYMLNPALQSGLEKCGLHIGFGDPSGQIADAISLEGHPFYKGMQGHPEQSSSPYHPHPLISAFIQAAKLGRRHVRNIPVRTEMS